MLENADTATAFSLTKTFKTLTSRWSAHIVTLRLIPPSKATPNESIFEMHTKVCVLKRAPAKPQTPFSCLFAAKPFDKRANCGTIRGENPIKGALP